jgi:hypothetical protein
MQPRRTAFSLKEHVAEFAREVHTEEAGEHRSATKDKAEQSKAVHGIRGPELVEVVYKLGHVSQLISEDIFHGIDSVFAAETAKQIIVTLLAGHIVEVPVSAEVEKLGSKIVHHPDTRKCQLSFAAIQQMAKDAGRNPSELRMIVRANLHITESPIEKDRHVFTGSINQIREDIAACEKIGAEEVFLEIGFTPGGQSLSNWQRLLNEFRPAKAPAN